MPEYRQDPVSQCWVIIAEDRAARPSDFISPAVRSESGRCPFCAGSEPDTPEAIAVYPEGIEDRSWKVRVIPNKYPAVLPTAEPGAHASSTPSPGELRDPRWFAPQPGFGHHEVLIESPRHVVSFTELDDELSQLALRAYQDRLTALRRFPALQYALVFKNCRAGGGATLEHVHSQLIATSIVPTDVQQELRTARHHLESSGHCLYCDLMREELTHTVRIVRETSHFVAYCPFAGRFPYETWIVPRVHACRFEEAGSSLVAELASLMHGILRSFESLSVETPYNFWIHTSPLQAACGDSFHWHMVLIPRVTTQAGYEWGSGCFVNPVAPESAAARLRGESAASPQRPSHL